MRNGAALFSMHLELNGVNCDPPVLLVNADLFWQIWLKSQRSAGFFHEMLPVSKSRFSSSWAKVKLTCQLGISQSNPMFPVTSSLKFSLTQYKARVPHPSNTDCACAQVLVLARLGMERPAVPSLPHSYFSILCQ